MPGTTFQELSARIRGKLRHTARFYSVDLHCHTPMSQDFGRKDGIREEDIDASPRDIAAAACEAGQFILAITDHHRCDTANAIRLAAEQIRQAGENRFINNNLVVLPGIEIAVEESGRTVHIIGVFPEGHDPAQIERVLDDSGVEPNPSLRREPCIVTRKRLSEIIQQIKRYGGLAIMAHVNSTHGFRQELREIGRSPDQILEAIVRYAVDAVEVSSPEDVPHFVHNGKKIACVFSSDAHYVQEIRAPRFSTHAKMTVPGFSDLKRALQDPDTRLRLAGPRPQSIRRIAGLEFSGGFLDGQTVAFTPDLNCLIGGRGTGKSTLIEAIRYVLQCPIPEAMQKRLEEMRREVFGGSTITLLFKDSAGDSYVLRRTFGEPDTHVLDMDGVEREDIDLSVTQNLKVNVYGWSEIEGTANSPAQQLDLIDSFVPAIPALKVEENAVLGSMRSNMRDIISQIEAINREQAFIGNLAEQRAELRRLGESETEEERRKAKSDTEKHMLDTIGEQVETALTAQHVESPITLIRAVRDQLRQATQEGSVLSIAEIQELLAAIETFVQANSILRRARASTLKELRRLSRIIRRTEALVIPNQRAASEAHERLLDRLDLPRDREITRRREQLRGDIQKKEQAVGRRALAEERLTQLRTSRQEMIRQLREIRRRLFESRNTHVGEIVRALPRRPEGISIDIHILQQGNRDVFTNLLEEKFVGLPRHWREQEYPRKIVSAFGPIEFAELLRNEDGLALSRAGFAPEEALDIISHFQRNEEQMLIFEMCDCSDRAVIELDVDGSPRPIEKLSPGQRCTALLPIILVETDSPLIIDQPEDNLDNQFVFDLVVATLRRLKEKRQILVATHNPNIPVSGDAENILVFRPIGGHGVVDLNGSIDYLPVIDAVETLMEGGKEAFRLRMAKYGIS